jgi:hypothetical protein
MSAPGPLAHQEARQREARGPRRKRRKAGSERQYRQAEVPLRWYIEKHRKVVARSTIEVRPLHILLRHTFRKSTTRAGGGEGRGDDLIQIHSRDDGMPTTDLSRERGFPLF